MQYFFFLGGGGLFTLKQYELFTLGTVSCFSELDIHCLNAKKTQNELEIEFVISLVQIKLQLKPFESDIGFQEREKPV